MNDFYADKINLLTTQWGEEPERVAMAVTFVAAIQARVVISPGMKCLEFGCGRGNLALMLPETVSIVATDSSGEVIEVLKRKVAGFNHSNIVPCQIEFLAVEESEQYDLIYSTLAMHHIKDISALLQKCARLLNQNGWLVIIDLDQEDGTFHDDNGQIFHFGFDRKELTQSIINAGFELKYMDEVYRREKVFANGNKRLYPLFIAVAQLQNNVQGRTR
jgi:ubiquinone/menaquinone biosynthesis C-methylase UbiE